LRKIRETRSFNVKDTEKRFPEPTLNIYSNKILLAGHTFEICSFNLKAVLKRYNFKLDIKASTDGEYLVCIGRGFISVGLPQRKPYHPLIIISF